MIHFRFLVVLAALVPVLLLPPTAAAQVPPANVRVGEVRLEPVQHLRLVTGQVEPAKRTLLSTQEQGQVIESPPEPGTPVKKGDILARLDARLLTITRAEAQAAFEQVQATLNEHQAMLSLAERTRTRLVDLVKSNVAREKELADARDEEAAAKARVELARAQLASAKARIDHLDQQIANMQIASPFDGYIVRKHTEVGQWVQPGDPVVELVMTSRVKVRLDVPETMVRQVPRDEPIDLTIVGINERRSANVFAIVPDADPNARTFRVLFKLPNDDGQLKPGMSVRSELPTGETSQALTVPKDAVQTTPIGSVVYVNRAGTAAQVPVMVRFPHADRFVIDGSLQPGEQVVIEGNERLFPGQPLTITDDPETAPTRAQANP